MKRNAAYGAADDSILSVFDRFVESNLGITGVRRVDHNKNSFPLEFTCDRSGEKIIRNMVKHGPIFRRGKSSNI